MGERATSSAPRVSVVVATRGRPIMLDACVRSVLACNHDSFELIVVDQTSEAADLPVDDRLVYCHVPGRGKSTGLNVGIATARGALLAFTDDDCTVPVDWLVKAEALLGHHPEAAMAFGNLTPMEHDPSMGFVPPTDLGRFRIVTGSSSAHIRGGAGANLIARRELFDTIGGYDELIGPGSRFAACEEYDIYYRALASGASVAMDPALDVTHWGFRPYADGSGRMLKRWYAYGEGAVIAKHIHLGDRHMLSVAARIIAQDLSFIASSLGRRRLSGVGMLAYKWRGLAAGLVTRVDRTRRLFDAAPHSRPWVWASHWMHLHRPGRPAV